MKSINLSQNLVAFVDDADFEWLNQYKWCAIKSKRTYYAVRTVYHPSKTTVYMHKEILCVNGLQTDHIDRNGLNNQRANLRAVTYCQNNQNKTKKTGKQFKGVYFSSSKANGRIYSYWRSKISNNGIEYDLGNFKTAIEAARAYDVAAFRLHGEFANTNFKDLI